MLISLLRKELRDLRAQTIAWSTGLGALLVLVLAVYPSISEVYADMIEQLPEQWLAFVGEGVNLNTLEGYLQAEVFSFLPIVLAIFAVLIGTATLVGEESKGTLDLLLAQPITRVRLATTKLAGLVIVLGIVTAVLLVVFWVMVPLMGLEASGAKATAAFVLLWPFSVGIAFLALLLSQLLPNRALAGTLTAAVIIAGYVLDSLAPSVSWLQPGRPVYVTAYFQGGNLLGAGIQWAYLGVLAGFVFTGAFAALWLFSRRDLGTRTHLQIGQLLRPRKTARR